MELHALGLAGRHFRVPASRVAGRDELVDVGAEFIAARCQILGAGVVGDEAVAQRGDAPAEHTLLLEHFNETTGTPQNRCARQAGQPRSNNSHLVSQRIRWRLIRPSKEEN